MKALAATGDADLIELVRVPDPSPAPGNVLVDVRAFSVNRGELHRLLTAAAGWRPGWDFAGVIADPGPPDAGDLVPGVRVFGIAAGRSWAERVAVPACQAARIPEGLSWEQAAALPTAALTALRTLRIPGDLTGARTRRDPGDLAGAAVLVTGAAGGVGRFAVQLARRAGAKVTAVVGRPERGRELGSLGADEVSVGTRQLAPGFDLILESGGGDSLREALRLVAPRGTVVSFGNSSRSETKLPVSDFYPKEAALRGFYLLNDLATAQTADDLTFLAGLVAAGELTVDLAHTAAWSEARAVLGGLRERSVPGKAVLRVTP
ncbi:zinc-binding dehydrogenase [Nonomuraea diastatica]|uniref:Alcohol dehydrogenase n=1 Tax=Nonomuraea diastatica TaxID=1848329 RepID=A0A4V2YFW1_9ACTN|nr:zinc-binding dehydrogenase [Nonomuraea diastatica]TDD24727.1 alcohol dehydrogenase [Nonomuraea diastatica]